MKENSLLGTKIETELMQLELQKSGANQKRYRCEKFAFDVFLFSI